MNDDTKELYLKERNIFNYKHLKVANPVVIAISGIYLIQKVLLPRNGEYDEFFLIYMTIFGAMFLLGIVFMISQLIKINMEEYQKNRLYLSYYGVLTFLALGLCYFDLHYGLELTAYIMIIMLLCTFPWLLPGEFAFLSGLAFFLLILSYLLLHQKIALQFYQILPGGMFYVVSWIIFKSIYTVRMESFLSRVTLEEQYRMLESESATDPLTGLYNRRYMKEDLEKELARSRRSRQPFCLSLLDLDHFKSINDRYGHMVGDDVLREMSSILRKSLRISDKVYRYGGEEFLVLFVDTPLDSAKVTAERLRKEIESHTLPKVKHGVTASFGLAVNEADLSLDILLQKADKRLYHAKQTGRNRVVWETPD